VGERREKGREVGSTSIPFSHSLLIGYFTLLNSIGLNLKFCLFCLFIIFLHLLYFGHRTIPCQQQIRKRKLHVFSLFKYLPVLSHGIEIDNMVDEIEMKMLEIQMK
jgi:hypothetical protein